MNLRFTQKTERFIFTSFINVFIYFFYNKNLSLGLGFQYCKTSSFKNRFSSISVLGCSVTVAHRFH